MPLTPEGATIITGPMLSKSPPTNLSRPVCAATPGPIPPASAASLRPAPPSSLATGSPSRKTPTGTASVSCPRTARPGWRFIGRPPRTSPWPITCGASFSPRTRPSPICAANGPGLPFRVSRTAAFFTARLFSPAPARPGITLPSNTRPSSRPGWIPSFLPRPRLWTTRNRTASSRSRSIGHSFVRDVCEVEIGDRLFRLDAGGADHLGPLLDFAGDKLAVVGGRPAPDQQAEVEETLPDPGIAQTGVDLLVESFDDFGGRVFGSRNAIPAARVIAGQEFIDGRHVRQDVLPLRGGHRQGTQLAGPDGRQRRRQNPEHHLNLSSKQIGDGGRLAAVGDA